MQNFLPCKNSPQNHCDVSGANGVIYEDLTNIHLRSNQLPTVSQPSIEVSFFSAGTLAKTLLHTRLSISLSLAACCSWEGARWRLGGECMYVCVSERAREKKVERLHPPSAKLSVLSLSPPDDFVSCDPF